MARVVQQRTSPPYLLIVMVFLFLITATLSVLFYMEVSKNKAELERRNNNLQRLADTDDLRKPDITKMMTWYSDPPDGERRGKTVLTRLSEQDAVVAQLITGQEVDIATAIAQTRNAFDKIGSSRGLLVELLDLNDQLSQARQQIAQKDQLLEQNQQDLQKKQELVDTVSGDLQGKLTALSEQVKQLDAQLADARADYKKQLDQFAADRDRQLDELNRNIAGKTRVIQDLQMTNQRMSEQLTRAQRELESKQNLPDSIQVAQRADGRILQVAYEENVCHINLGEKDNVSPGLTFSVYPPTGIPESGEGKGKIIITNVGKTTSECRIVESKSSDPIVVNDLIGNVAFDPTRTYTFAIEGAFDLYGTGNPTQEGAKEVAMLISRSGGKVVDKLDLNTDFLVLGSEPPRPIKPAETAPAQTLRAYRDDMETYNRYNEFRQTAENMHIPILNTSRFLAFMGTRPSAK